MRKTLAERESIRRAQQDERGAAEPAPETEEARAEREASEAESLAKTKAQKIVAIDKSIARRPAPIDPKLSGKKKRAAEDDRRALGWSGEPDELEELQTQRAELESDADPDIAARHCPVCGQLKAKENPTCGSVECEAEYRTGRR